MSALPASLPEHEAAAPARHGFHVFPAGHFCSLRHILLIWLVPMIALLAGASAAFSYWHYSSMVNEFMDDQMRVLGRSLAAHDAPQPPWTASASATQKGTYVIQVWDAAGALRASSLPGARLSAQAPGFHDLSDGKTPWRVFATPMANGKGTVQVSQNAQFRKHLVVDRALAVIAPLAILLALAVTLLWAVSGAMSRAVRDIGQHAARQDENSISELPLDRVPQEIRPLVVAFNSLLARLRHAFTSQRRLVQDAAHELRTPITALALQLENVRRDMPPGACQQSFAQLEQGVRRAQRLVEQLMKLSHQQSATAEPRTLVNVHEQVRQSIGVLLPLADQRDIDLGLLAAPRPELSPALLCAPADFRSALDNLVENALRYTPPGGVVDVRIGVEGARWFVEVADTGPGIPPELLSRVFDRFYRVEGSPAGGSGLGLAIAQEAAQRCGLRIVLANRKDCSGLCARIEPT
ncbi:MAG TPA: ATP-binding protein [Ramlibacter sp.]|jgi:signal transduction histidine kinase|nr:ATP-binding protein [Ramlibacter sp.]